MSAGEILIRRKATANQRLRIPSDRFEIRLLAEASPSQARRSLADELLEYLWRELPSRTRARKTKPNHSCDIKRIAAAALRARARARNDSRTRSLEIRRFLSSPIETRRFLTAYRR